MLFIRLLLYSIYMPFILVLPSCLPKSSLAICSHSQPQANLILLTIPMVTFDQYQPQSVLSISTIPIPTIYSLLNSPYRSTYSVRYNHSHPPAQSSLFPLLCALVFDSLNCSFFCRQRLILKWNEFTLLFVLRHSNRLALCLYFKWAILSTSQVVWSSYFPISWCLTATKNRVQTDAHSVSKVLLIQCCIYRRWCTLGEEHNFSTMILPLVIPWNGSAKSPPYVTHLASALFTLVCASMITEIGPWSFSCFFHSIISGVLFHAPQWVHDSTIQLF